MVALMEQEGRLVLPVAALLEVSLGSLELSSPVASSDHRQVLVPVEPWVMQHVLLPVAASAKVLDVGP